jgi:uncharacterized protein YihD (DUF1040 family)
MIRYAKSGISLLIFLAIAAPTLPSQNIYDHDHSREFARYLMVTQQYNLAAGEWERVLFLNPADTAARLNLVKSYRLSGQPEKGWSNLNAWNPAGSLTNDFAREAIQLTFNLNDFQSFRSVMERSAGLPEPERDNYYLGAWLLEGQWAVPRAIRKADPAWIDGANRPLLDLYDKTGSIRYKSPAAATALSAVIPGLGKIYSHDWKDGLFSLLFVGTNVWQSYRGFSRNGIESVTGWIFGALAAGFYTANLFGSWKSASDYNHNQIDLIRHEAESLLYTR